MTQPNRPGVTCSGCNGSGNYDDTERATRDNGCDHKFVDSEHCLKCGWTPCPQCKGLGIVRPGVTWGEGR